MPNASLYLLSQQSPGGMYVCITPNRLFGPHDVSKYFDRTASGFHLKEYTLSELKPLFQAAGFQRVPAYAGTRGRFAQVPLRAVTLLENIVSAFPWRLRRHAAELPLLRHLLSAAVIGWNPVRSDSAALLDQGCPGMIITKSWRAR
jgi:hypothetical protein